MLKTIGYLAIAMFTFQVAASEAFAGPSFFDLKDASFELETDLNAVFEAAKSGGGNDISNGDVGEEPPVFPGVLKFPDSEKTLKVEVSYRGNSSLRACPFPKLKIDFKKSEAKGTPLEGLSSLRLNTHCGEPTTDGSESERILGDRGPEREGFVYDLARLLGQETFRSRVAHVTYRQTGSQKVLEHQALAIEAKKDMGARLGGKVVDGFNYETEDPEAILASLDLSQVAKVELFHVLIGNADRYIGIKDSAGQKFSNPTAPLPDLWNYSLLCKESERPLLVPYDFDVSLAVMQYDMNTGSDPVLKQLSGCGSGVCEEVFFATQYVRGMMTKTALDSARTFYLAKIDSILALIDGSRLDKTEKQYMAERTKAFADVLQNRLYVPVVANPGVKIYLDADLKKACGLDGYEDEKVDISIPVGYLVHVIEKGPKATRIELIKQIFRPIVNPVTGLDCTSVDTWIDSSVELSPDFPK